MTEQLFLITKRGLYYRPNAKGYTGVKKEAGRYTLDEVAVRFPNLDSPRQDGLGYVSEAEAPEFSPACCSDIKARVLLEERDALLAERARTESEGESASAGACTASGGAAFEDLPAGVEAVDLGCGCAKCQKDAIRQFALMIAAINGDGEEVAISALIIAAAQSSHDTGLRRADVLQLLGESYDKALGAAIKRAGGLN